MADTYETGLTGRLLLFILSLTRHRQSLHIFCHVGTSLFGHCTELALDDTWGQECKENHVEPSFQPSSQFTSLRLDLDNYRVRGRSWWYTSVRHCPWIRKATQCLKGNWSALFLGVHILFSQQIGTLSLPGSIYRDLLLRPKLAVREAAVVSWKYKSSTQSMPALPRHEQPLKMSKGLLWMYIFVFC